MSFRIRSLENTERRWYRRVSLQKVALVALTFGRPFLRLYFDWKDRKAHEQRVIALKRAVVLLLTLLFGLVLLSALTRAFVAVRELTFTTFPSISGDAPDIDAFGHTNVLLLGQGDVTGEDLTDSVIVVSLDLNQTKSAVLLSLPRDLYFLSTDRMGKGRINSFYRDFKHHLQFREEREEREASLEALRELKDEVGRALNLDIHHAVKVDFEGFVKAVDAIDGIAVDVPYDILDREYPGPNYTYETFELRKGQQRLDGETALKYARSRSTTSDFARSDRQQQLLKALAAKVEVQSLLKNPSRIASLFNILRDHVETTLSLRETVGLSRAGLNINPDRIIAMQLHDRNGLYGEILHSGGFLYTPPRQFFDGASVLLPISLPEFPVTWKQIQTLKTLLIDDRTLYLQPRSIAVLNAGASPGSALKLGNELIRYGFRVDRVANASLPHQDESLTDADTLGSMLKIPIRPLSQELSPEERLDVTIVLGKDYRYTPLQYLLER